MIWPTELEWFIDNKWRCCVDTFNYLIERGFTSADAREYMEGVKDEGNVRQKLK